MERFVSVFLCICFTQLQLSLSINNVSLDEGRMLVSWTYDAADDKLSFQVNATANGWIGIGFALSAPNSMKDYDVVLAGCKEGQGYIYDMYSMGQAPPPLDSSQDFSLVMATEVEGHTILHIERAGNTGDVKDIQFMNNTEVFIVWALHSSVDAINSSVYPFHERKGSSGAKYMIGPKGVSQTQPKATSIGIMPPSTLLEEKIPSSVIPTDKTADRMIPKALSEQSSKASSMNVEFKSTVVNPSGIPFESKSTSISHTDLNQQSYKGAQNSVASSFISPSWSSDGGLESTTKSLNTPSSGSSIVNAAEKDSGHTKDEGKDQKNWVIILPLGVFLAATVFVATFFFSQPIMLYFNFFVMRLQIWLANYKLPRENPTECEALIRKLHSKIGKQLIKAQNKEKLLDMLRDIAHLGMHQDLKQMIEDEALHLERTGLNLVVNRLTNVPKLAEYLYRNSRDPRVVEEAGLKNVSKSLGANLEVLGALTDVKIDTSKDWVKTLCVRAPSLQALSRLKVYALENCCKGADDGEMEEVYRLYERAELQYSRKVASIRQDKTLERESNATKAKDIENLRRAEELLDEAKVMTTNQTKHTRKIVKEKLSTIITHLELPSAWSAFPDSMTAEQFNQLEKKIERCRKDVESAQSYKSEVDLIVKASAGRALFGIYHSKYKPPTPPPMRLIREPTVVTLTSPASAQEICYMTFSARGLATEYTQKVTSSSTNIGLALSGFHGLLAVKIQGGRGKTRQADQFQQNYNTSASALHYIRTAKKSFQLQRDEIKLSTTARSLAKLIARSKETTHREKLARRFMKSYGSHYPLGVQTLGGVFFSIADVESEETRKTTTLSNEAVKYLKSKMSVMVVDESLVGARIYGEHTDNAQKQDSFREESEHKSFTYNAKSIGPPANPATFQKLLSYSSNWGLIDRGEIKGYTAVWELVRDLGDEFEIAAQVLEETWNEDEQRRKEKVEAEFHQRKQQEEMRNAREELCCVMKDHLKSQHNDVAGTRVPENEEPRFPEIERKEAYDKAIAFVMRDPHHHICVISSRGRRKYSLTCFAAPKQPPKLRKDRSRHVLFYSNLLFQWKDHCQLK